MAKKTRYGRSKFLTINNKKYKGLPVIHDFKPDAVRSAKYQRRHFNVYARVIETTMYSVKLSKRIPAWRVFVRKK